MSESRSVEVEVTAKVTDAVAGMDQVAIAAKKAAGATDQLGASTDKAQAKQSGWARSSQYLKTHKDSIDKVSNAALGIGVAMTAAAAVAVTRNAQFEKSMSRVASTGDDARNSLSQLREVAIQAGADTQYSASEAADGITEMAKAGVSAKDMIEGGLIGALNLAAAGELSVADASEISATALKQFGLQGKDMGHVADLLAAGAGKAQGSVMDLAGALKYVGPVAHGMGISIDETVGTLAMFAEQGILGESAGTALRGVLMSMTSPSAAAAKEMKKLGIELYDGTGKFKGMENVAGQLGNAYGDMTDKARDASLGVIFGNAQVTAARILFGKGAEGIKEWTAAVNDAGYASRASALLMDNLSGDFEKLSGSLDTVFIKSGSGANATLRGIVQGANAVVDAIGQIPGPILSIGTALTGVAGLALAGTGGMLKMVTAVSEGIGAFKNLGASAKTAKIAVAGVGGALAIGTIALTMWASAAADAKAASDELSSTLVVVNGQATTTAATQDVIYQTLEKNTNGILGFGQSIASLGSNLGLSQKEMTGYVLGNADAVASVTQKLDAYQTAQTKSGNTDYWATGATRDLKAGLDSVSGSLSEAQKQAMRKAEADQAAASGSQTYAQAQTAAQSSTDAATQSLQEYVKMLFDAANAALQLSGTQIGFEAAIDDTAAAIKKTGEATDLNTAKGRANQTALNQLATSSIAYVSKLVEQGATEEKVASTMERARNAYIKNAKAAGYSKDQAAALADQMGLIPEQVYTDYKLTGTEQADQDLIALQQGISDLPTDTQTEVISIFKNQGIKAAISALNGIDGETADAIVKSILKREGINAWNGYNPPDKSASINVDVNYNRMKSGKLDYFGNPVKKASGGSISGEGTSTSDSIPAMLSDGEHVWSAEEVQKAGGHAAMERARAASRAGILHLASGGAAKKKAAKKAAAERAKARADLLRELKVDVRRGNIKESVSSGSGLSIIDQMLDWSRDTNLSSSARSGLASSASKYESQLSSIYKKLEGASKKLDELQNIYNSVTSHLDSFSFDTEKTYTENTSSQGTWYTENAMTGASLAGQAQSKAATLKTFAAKLAELKKAGAGPELMQQVASLDPATGIQVADAFLADTGSISATNQALSDTTKYAKEAAQTVTEASYEGGLAAAQGVVDGLNKQADAIAKSLADALAKALGYKVSGTTLKKRAVGGSINANQAYLINETGPEVFVSGTGGHVLNRQQAMSALGGSQSSNAWVGQLLDAVKGMQPGVTINGSLMQPANNKDAQVLQAFIEMAPRLIRARG